jgi:hypothetical protein
MAKGLIGRRERREGLKNGEEVDEGSVLQVF